MVYQRVDPTPFIPHNMQLQEVPNREFMTRAVAPITPPANNEDLAIAVFDPLPGNDLQFAAVWAVLRDFLRDEVHVTFRHIQPTHLGQALVKFTHVYDRDTLVLDSPHIFSNVSVSFVKHNEGRNCRRLQFNQHYWLLLLGFPNDYHIERHSECFG